MGLTEGKSQNRLLKGKQSFGKPVSAVNDGDYSDKDEI